MALAVGYLTVVVFFEEGVVTVFANFAGLFFTAENRVGDAVVVHEAVSWFALVADNHVAQSNVTRAVQDSLFALSVFERESSSTVDAVAFEVLSETANNRFTDTFFIFQEQSNFTDLADASEWISVFAARLGSFSLILALAISRKKVVEDALSAGGCGGISVAAFDVSGSDTDA